VIGTIEGTRSGKVDDYDYLFPVVRAEAIHLWPERAEERDVYYGVGPYWSPFYWGGGSRRRTRRVRRSSTAVIERSARRRLSARVTARLRAA
jgi:outer membrane lipoprotein